MILDVVVLNFVPTRSENPDIRKIFADEMSRTFWLGIKQGHIVQPRFNKDCMHYAVEARRAKERGELTAEKLLEIISDSICGTPESRDEALAFCEEFLPFIIGEKTMRYAVMM